MGGEKSRVCLPWSSSTDFYSTSCRVTSGASAIMAFWPKNQRGVKLPLIRKLLGMPEGGLALEEDDFQPEEAEGEDGGKSTLERPCPVCKRGVLVVISWPRPTIAEIMQMPLEQLQQCQLPFQ